MKAKTFNDFIGGVLSHKVYGDVVVLEVTSPTEGKFIGKIMSTNEIKKFIFSKNYFKCSKEKITWYDVPVKTPYKAQRKKEVDYNKIRNHPLVKKIDQIEAGYRPKFFTDEEHEDPEELDN